MPRHPKLAEPGQTNRLYLRLPTDVVERIEAKAKAEGRPFNRIVIDELALFPHLDRQARFGELIRKLETILARHESRLTVTEFNEALLHAVDQALAARTGQRQQLARLRAIRRTMLESERRATTHVSENRARRIGLRERTSRGGGGAAQGRTEPGLGKRQGENEDGL